MSSRPTPRASARVTRAGLVGGLVLTLALPAGMAIADPVFPSQEQVDGAKRAVGDAATQVAQLDAVFAAASARLEAAQERAAAAAEEYNGAKLMLDRAKDEAAAASKDAGTAQVAADDAGTKVRQYAASVYQQNGSLADLDAFMSSKGPQELVDRLNAMETVGAARNRTLQSAASTSQIAAGLRAQADRAKAQQQAAADAAEKARRAAEQQQATATATAASVRAEQEATVAKLAQLQKSSVVLEQQRQAGLRAEAERKARAAAAARAQAAAAQAERVRQTAAAADRAKRERERASRDNRPSKPSNNGGGSSAGNSGGSTGGGNSGGNSGGGNSGGGTSTPPPATTPPPPPPPPTSGGVAAVLSYARAQLGKPYLWGGAGPNSFDCSGLTLMAWRRAGVYLAHYTGFQYSSTARVAIADLRPGDLVFYGSSGPSSHHMGLYVGGGQMIEAPHSGAVVRYASIYRSDLLPYGGRPS